MKLSFLLLVGAALCGSILRAGTTETAIGSRPAVHCPNQTAPVCLLAQ